MTKLILLAGAAIALGASPVAAKPNGQGHGKAQAHGGGHATTHAHSRQRMIDRNRNGIADWRDDIRARDHRYGGAACPPGLAKKSPACIPPGQAKRMFRQGQRLPAGYRYYTPFGNLPLSLRDRYNLSDDNRYIYRDNTIYVVDPATSLVSRIINAIL